MNPRHTFKNLLLQFKNEVMAIDENTYDAYFHKRIEVYFDLKKAQEKLLNFSINLSIRQHLPTYGDISFIHPDLQRFDSLKKFT